jgi:hypothetical protein
MKTIWTSESDNAMLNKQWACSNQKKVTRNPRYSEFGRGRGKSVWEPQTMGSEFGCTNIESMQQKKPPLTPEMWQGTEKKKKVPRHLLLSYHIHARVSQNLMISISNVAQQDGGWNTGWCHLYSSLCLCHVYLFDPGACG